MSDKLKEIKNSGHFKRKIRENYLKILATTVEATQYQDAIIETPVLSTNSLQCDLPSQLHVKWTPSRTDVEYVQNLPLYTELRKWDISFNIKHNALKELMLILKNRLPNVFPKDSHIAYN